MSLTGNDLTLEIALKAPITPIKWSTGTKTFIVSQDQIKVSKWKWDFAFSLTMPQFRFPIAENKTHITSNWTRPPQASFSLSRNDFISLQENFSSETKSGINSWFYVGNKIYSQHKNINKKNFSFYFASLPKDKKSFSWPFFPCSTKESQLHENQPKIVIELCEKKFVNVSCLLPTKFFKWKSFLGGSPFSCLTRSLALSDFLRLKLDPMFSLSCLPLKKTLMMKKAMFENSIEISSRTGNNGETKSLRLWQTCGVEMLQTYANPIFFR